MDTLKLTSEEEKKLELLNKRADKLNKIKDSIFDKTLNELLGLWSKYNIEVLDELIIFFSKLDMYSNYFSNIDDTQNLYQGIKIIFIDFFKIIFKEQRLIYIGITIIIISLCLYFIGVSS